MNKPKRIVSLDVFRGMTMVLMTLVNNPGDWGHIYSPFRHAEWHGCTLTDLVFPFFIFISGVALSVAHRRGPITSSSLELITARSLRIFLLGLALSFYSKINPFDWEGLSLVLVRVGSMVLLSYLLLKSFAVRTKFLIATVLFILMMVLAFGTSTFESVRIPGVLQRIGIVYFIIAILYRLVSLRGLVIVSVGILLGYWLLMMLVPVPGIGISNLDPTTNLAAWVDHQLLPGHLWSHTKVWDPEGVLSTLPAIVTGILGIIAGYFLKKKELKSLWIVGISLIVTGWLWGLHFPINKALWTSSYVLYTGGIACCILALLEQIRLPKVVSNFFTTWGMNAIFVFFASGIIPRILHQLKVGDSSLFSYLYHGLYKDHISDACMASLLWALGYVLFWTAILYVMKHRKWYLKV